MTEFNDIFNLSNEDFIEKNEKKVSEYFKPDPKKGKDNTYKALIRFIPFYKDPKKSKIKKYSYWLTDPLTSDGFSVDCPSTINQKSILQDTFWKLKKSPSVAEQKLSDKFKRRENYYSLIQIVKDDQEPENVGKIKIFKFGQKLNNIIQGEIQPEYGKPSNPYDPFKGRVMALHVNIVAGFNNYDTTKFVGDESPVIIDGKPIEKTQEGMNAFVEYLKANSPALENCDFRPWTEDEKAKIKSVIENTVPGVRTMETTAKAAAIETPTPVKSQTITSSSEVMPEAKTAPAGDAMDELNLELDNTSFDEDLYAGL